MRIGIEAQRIFRPKKHGMDIVALESIRALQELDQENDYFVFVKPDTDTSIWKPSANFQLVELPAYSYLDWEQYQLPKAIKKYQLDLLHCTANTAPIHLNIPLLITLHDIIYLERFSLEGSLYQVLGSLYRRWNIPKIYKKAQRLITVSNFEKNQIINTLQVNQAQVEVVYNAVTPQFRQYPKEELINAKIKYKLPNHFIFYLGNQAPKKNMPNVLKGYAWYCKHTERPLPLVIAESSPEQVWNLLTKLKETSIFSQIQCLSYVPQGDLPYVYNLASLFLYPSLRESFGIPIVEAMACGTPTITSNTSAMPEIAGEAGFLVNPHSMLSIGEGILQIMQDKLLQEKLKQNGLARAKHFSWKNTAQQLLQIYQLIGVKQELSIA